MAIRNQIVQIATDYSDQNITEIQTNDGWTDKQYEPDMQSIGWVKGDKVVCGRGNTRLEKRIRDQSRTMAARINTRVFKFPGNGNKFHADPVWPTSIDVPILGAIVVWQAGNSLAEGHTGIVVAINGNQFTSVEGNTTSDTKANPDPKASVRDGWTVGTHTHTIGLPHSTLGLNLDRFIYAIESYSPPII